MIKTAKTNKLSFHGILNLINNNPDHKYELTRTNWKEGDFITIEISTDMNKMTKPKMHSKSSSTPEAWTPSKEDLVTCDWKIIKSL